MAALSNLSNLQHLDLSLNDFDRAILVPQIGRLTNLAYLDISNAGFSWKIPAEIGNLTRLKTLLLANLYRPSDAKFHVRAYFEIENLNWLSRLGQLRSLLLDGVDLSGVRKDWGPAVSSLRQLARLSLAECALFPLFPDESGRLRNLSASLRHLDLSGNRNRDFSTQIPAWLQNFTALQMLDLSGYALFGSVVENIARLLNLQHLNLGYNDFRGASK